VHFIYPVWDNTRPLSYLNYIAIKRAKVIQKPDVIKLWINKQPEPSPYWLAIESMVEVNVTPMDGTFEGVKIEYPQLQSDVTRLEILHREGGIYMDTDMLLLRDLDPYRYDTFSMGLEPQGDGMPSACNALMLSEPGSDFTRLWLDNMAEALKNPVWAYGGVVMPYKLYEERPDLITMYSHEHFCPFNLSKNWLFGTDDDTIAEGKRLARESTAIHGFETYWRDVVKEITPDWCRKNNSIFSELVI
jgi:hypothetical protein